MLRIFYLAFFVLFFNSGHLIAAPVDITSFSVRPFTDIESGNRLSLHTRVCGNGVSVDGQSISGQQCARLKIEFRPGKRLEYHIIFESSNFSIFPIKTDDKDGDNYKFWLRANPSEDTQNFSNFLKRSPPAGTAVIGALCKKFSNKIFFNRYVESAVESAGARGMLSSSVLDVVNKVNAASTFMRIATRCYKTAERHIGPILVTTGGQKASLKLIKSVCGVVFEEGKTRSDLMSIQRGLAKRNLYNGEIDGNFGKGSCSALTKWVKCENVSSKTIVPIFLAKLINTNPSSREMSCYGSRPVPTEKPKILSVNSTDDYRDEIGQHTIMTVEMRNRWGNQSSFKLNGLVAGTKPNEVCLNHGDGSNGSLNKCFSVYSSKITIESTIADFNKRDKENITDACSLIATQFNEIYSRTKNSNSKKLLDQKKSAFSGFAYQCLLAIQSTWPGTKYATISSRVGVSALKVNGTNVVAVPIDQGGPCNQSKFQVLLNQRVLKDLGLYTSVIDGVSGPKYRKAIAGGEKLLAQWVDGKKYCLSGSERKVLEAVVVAGKRGSSCKYLLSSNQIKYSFDFLRLNRLTDRSYINHKDISGLIWMIDTASELEMRLSLLKFYEETLRPTGTNTRDCRLDVAELKALTQSGSQAEALAGSIDTSQNSGPVKPASKIIEEPTCDDDPLLCPLVQLCERASYYDDGKKAWRTDISASEHVTLAKQQGVSCGVMTNTVTSAAIATCEANPSACSLAELCRTAISFKTGSLSWSTDTALQPHVEFAQNAGISCGIPKPVVASNIITPPVDPVQVVKTTTLGKYTNRKALVIGNSQYSQQTPLRNPSSDAAEIARSLEEVGFEVELALDLTRRELGRAITRFSSNAKEADISLFYFAGHGIEIDGRNYLVPIDALMDDPAALEYDVIDLQKAIDAAAGSSKLSLVMVDACRDNPFNTQVAGLNRSVSRGLKVIETDAVSKNQIVSFAAESGQVAEDGTDKNSPYAKAFSDLVVQPNLEVGKLFRQLSDSVSMLTNGRQVPVTRTRLSSEDMFFAIER